MKNLTGPIQAAILQKLREEFLPSHLEVQNESHGHSRNPTGETHFNILLVSPKFQGKSLVQRHQWVHNLFQTEREQGLHALTLRTLTPSEWSAAQDTAALASPGCASGASDAVTREKAKS